MKPILPVILSSILVPTRAAITILPGGKPLPYNGPAGAATADDFFRKAVPGEFLNASAKIVYHSDINNLLSANSPDSVLLPSGDSFVRGAIQAWGEHMHLVLRPEEVWFAILVQMNFYMQSHAEEVRDLFVAHEGKKEIEIAATTWESVIGGFRGAIQERVKTEWLMDWIGPGFSTSEEGDYLTASVLMMGLMKAYFDFSGGIICGLPSVTLLGKQSDWEMVLKRLDRLPLFGKEPAEYAGRLRPILSRFVTSFKEPDSEATKLFWNQIVAAKDSRGLCGAPEFYVSGWILGFIFWDDHGKRYNFANIGSKLTLDNITYSPVDPRKLPVGYAKANFTIKDYSVNPPTETPAFVLAGNLGKHVSKGPAKGYLEAVGRSGGKPAGELDNSTHATLQPKSAWMLYGPVDVNAEIRPQTAEQRDGTLMAAIRSNFNEGLCSV